MGNKKKSKKKDNIDGCINSDQDYEELKKRSKILKKNQAKQRELEKNLKAVKLPNRLVVFVDFDDNRTPEEIFNDRQKNKRFK